MSPSPLINYLENRSNRHRGPSCGSSTSRPTSRTAGSRAVVAADRSTVPEIRRLRFRFRFRFRVPVPRTLPPPQRRVPVRCRSSGHQTDALKEPQKGELLFKALSYFYLLLQQIIIEIEGKMFAYIFWSQEKVIRKTTIIICKYWTSHKP